MVLSANIHALCHGEFIKTQMNPKLAHICQKKFITGRSMGHYRKSLRLAKTYGGLLHLSVSTRCGFSQHNIGAKDFTIPS